MYKVIIYNTAHLRFLYCRVRDLNAMSSAAVPFTYKAVGIQTSRTENAISITLLVALILTSIVEKTTSLDSDPTAGNILFLPVSHLLPHY